MLPGKLVEDEYIAEPAHFRPETVFRLCTIEAGREGASLEGALLWCAVEGFDWYAPFFNSVVIANTNFRDMVFSGASFRGCQFVECTFERCLFTLDNLGAPCTIDNCSFTECHFVTCEVETAPGRKVVTRTRWYGCTQRGCTGLVF